MPVSGKGDLRVRLTQFSNFSVRVLMYAGLNDGRLSAVPEMARAYGVSYDHLKKAATELCRLGYLETVRGRGGGFRLAMHPETIRIGEVIRQTEGDVRLVECFDAAVNTCPLIGPCQLRVALHEALAAFFVVLGCFLDGISMVVLTIGVVMPTVVKAGIDPLWFGIFVVLVVEMAQITPPVGFNLLVLQGMTGREIGWIARVTMPFFWCMAAAIVLVTVFPAIVTVLPQTVMAR